MVARVGQHTLLLALTAGGLAGCTGLSAYNRDTGVQGPALTVSPEGGIDFGYVKQDSLPAEKEITLSSVGSENVRIIDIYLDDLSSTAFSVYNYSELPLPKPLKPGDDFVFKVTFAPYGVGPYSGTLQVKLDPGDQDFTYEEIPLQGQGCNPPAGTPCE